jgi:hypothetical protein
MDCPKIKNTETKTAIGAENAIALCSKVAIEQIEQVKIDVT